MTLTAAVVSRNEAHLLPACLARLGWVDELVVLDMESTDATVEVARAAGARVVPVPLVPIAERIRQVALDAATTDWVLFVDPDELFPTSFADEVAPHLARPEVAAYRLPLREVAFGTPLEHAFAGARKIALVRRGHVTYPEAIVAHQEPDTDGPVVDLMDLTPIEHHSRPDVASAAEKAVRYGVSGGVAATGIRGDDPFLLARLWFRGVVRGGAWRDGRPGIAAVSLVAIGEYIGALQQWEDAGYPDPPLSRRRRWLLSWLARARSVATRARRP